MIKLIILMCIGSASLTRGYDPEMFMQENDNFGGTKGDFYMNNFKGQYRYSFENPNTIKQLQDGYSNGGKVGFYSFVGPDGRFYITCYTAVNGYRAKSIIVVTDLPYEDLQEFCQTKFNVVTNTFNDLSDVKEFISKKKKTESASGSAVVTPKLESRSRLEGVKPQIESHSGANVAKPKIESRSGLEAVTPQIELGSVSKTETTKAESNSVPAGKSDSGINATQTETTTKSRTGNHKIKVTSSDGGLVLSGTSSIVGTVPEVSKIPSNADRGSTTGRSSTRGRSKSQSRSRGGTKAKEPSDLTEPSGVINRGGKAAIATNGNDVSDIEISRKLETSATPDIKTPIRTKVSAKISESIPKKAEKLDPKPVPVPNSDIHLIAGKIPLTDQTKVPAETDILIPVKVADQPGGETVFSQIVSDKGGETEYVRELLNIDIPEEGFIPESLTRNIKFDPTNGKASAGDNNASQKPTQSAEPVETKKPETSKVKGSSAGSQDKNATQKPTHSAEAVETKKPETLKIKGPSDGAEISISSRSNAQPDNQRKPPPSSTKDQTNSEIKGKKPSEQVSNIKAVKDAGSVSRTRGHPEITTDKIEPSRTMGRIITANTDNKSDLKISSRSQIELTEAEFDAKDKFRKPYIELDRGSKSKATETKINAVTIQSDKEKSQILDGTLKFEHPHKEVTLFPSKGTTSSEIPNIVVGKETPSIDSTRIIGMRRLNDDNGNTNFNGQCVGQLVTKIVTQPAQTVTVTQTIQPTHTEQPSISVPTSLLVNSCRAKIVVEDSTNKKLMVLSPNEAEMISIRARAAKSLYCGTLSFLSK